MHQFVTSVLMIETLITSHNDTANMLIDMKPNSYSSIVCFLATLMVTGPRSPDGRRGSSFSKNLNDTTAFRFFDGLGSPFFSQSGSFAMNRPMAGLFFAAPNLTGSDHSMSSSSCSSPTRRFTHRFVTSILMIFSPSLMNSVMSVWKGGCQRVGQRFPFMMTVAIFFTTPRLNM